MGITHVASCGLKSRVNSLNPIEAIAIRVLLKFTPMGSLTQDLRCYRGFCNHQAISPFALGLGFQCIGRMNADVKILTHSMFRKMMVPFIATKILHPFPWMPFLSLCRQLCMVMMYYSSQSWWQSRTLFSPAQLHKQVRPMRGTTCGSTLRSICVCHAALQHATPPTRTPPHRSSWG